MVNSIVSVVMPAFNSADHVVEALDSVLRQTYKSFEVIVVNDGSTDSTGDILAKYENLIKVISTENNGASVARNIGVLESKGNYIAFLDSDDIWHPDKLKIQIEYFEENTDVSMVANRREKFIDSHNVHFNKEKSFGAASSLDHYTILHRNPIHCSSVLIKRNALARSNLFDPRTKGASEDTELWARIARTQTIILGNDILSWLRDHAGNTTKTYGFRTNQLNSLNIMEKYWSDDVKAIKIIKKNMRGSSVALAYEAADRMEFDVAKKCFIKAFLLGPTRVKFLLKYVYYLFRGMVYSK